MTAFPKPTRAVNPQLLEAVRLQPCAACGAKPSDPHHVKTRGAGGGDTRDNVMPLCRYHHQIWHQIGPAEMINRYPGVFSWLVKHDREDVWESMDGKTQD